MKRNLSAAMVVIVFATTLLVNIRATAQGVEPACSLSQTAGKWGFSTDGTVVGIGPRQSIGIFTLDAAGNVVNGKGTASLNGMISDEVFSGAYTVNADCTGTMTVEFFDPSGDETLAATGDLVFVQNMRELRLIYRSAVLSNGTALAPVIVVDAKKVREP